MNFRVAFRLSPVHGFAIAAALLALLPWVAPARAAECTVSGVGAGVLPDCRVYEQVSPLDKGAFEAGALGFENPGLSMASPDGSRVLYSTSGAMGETETGLQVYTMSTRGPNGWTTKNAFPRPGDPSGGVGYGHTPSGMLPSEDLSQMFFGASMPWLPEIPVDPDQPTGGTSTAAYLMRADQSIEWLTEPQLEGGFTPTSETPWKSAMRFRFAGTTRNLDRLYFSTLATLLPGDEARIPYAEEAKGLGLYEYAEGELRHAGTLPDGTLHPQGAAAAGSVAENIGFVDKTSPETFHNQVSEDGRVLWFVSPDPTGEKERVAQLYARVDGQPELASRSELTGEPAASGTVRVPNVTRTGGESGTYSYAHGSRDGSRAFFQSVDALTVDAPDDGLPKAYMYEVASDDVVYLPGVAGHFLATDHDGSHLLLLSPGKDRIELWREGSGVTLVSETSFGAAVPAVRPTADGSVFAFAVTAELPGFPNPAALSQVYRYETGSGELACLSCPPQGPPTTEAVVERVPSAGTAEADGIIRGQRVMSADGKWVFFDTGDALVPADTNGKRDAYRWGPDGPRLISSGRARASSFILDISVDGETAFFATSEGLAPLDSDGSYDVYAARVGGGFPSLEVPACEGDECQGPGSGPPPLASSGSDERGRSNLGPRPRRFAARLGAKAGKLRLRIKVPGAGRVVASGPQVRPLKRQIARAGSYTLLPKLKPAARQTLKRQGELLVRVKVRFLPEQGRPSSRTVTAEVTR